jgi:hypothetical protein
MTASDILKTAETIVSGDRQRDYGRPRDNHGCTAALWSAYLLRRFEAKQTIPNSAPLTLDARDVCWLNILQKASRDANRRKDDNLTDTVGYALNAAMVDEPETKGPEQ